MKVFMKTLMAGAVAIAAFVPSVSAGDAAQGEKVFRKCKACHSVEPGKKMMGPSLADVMGRTAGTLKGFKYSPAMAESGIVWTEETIAEYLRAPRTYIKGNRMAFMGLKKDNEIADVIAYLKAHSE